MITFTKEQIEGFSAEEKEMLNELVRRGKAKVADEQDEVEEYRANLRKHIQDHFQREKENENYTKTLESQFV